MPRANVAVLALALMVAFGACNHAADSTSASASNDGGGHGGAGACDDDACRALDSECARGVCSSASGLCVLEPLRDGQTCAPDNPCGEAHCRAGECIPSSPPDCSALDDACHVGECSVADGCVAVLVERAGLDCEHAAPVRLDGPPVTIDPACGLPGDALADCGAPAGNAAHFDLDLTAFARAVPVRLLFGAEFELSSVIRRGECRDPASVACGRNGDWVSARGSVELREMLEPGHYTIVAAGVEAGARGPIQLAASFDAAPECATSVERASCADAEPLDGMAPVQVRVGSAACVESGTDLECDGYTDEATLYFSLDLAERAAPALVDVELDGYLAVLTRADSRACGEVVECGGYFRTLLEPDAYVLGLVPWSDQDFALRVGVQDASACDALPNTSCDNAVVLDPSSTTHRLRGLGACGVQRVDDDCGNTDRDPQLFYRLDLRGYSTPVRVEVEGASDDSYLSIVEANAGGGCGAMAGCFAPFVLAPGLYYLVVHGGSGSEFDFRVELSPQAAPDTADCVAREVVECARDSAAACTRDGVDDPACVAALKDCGSSWSGLSEVCSLAPWCCEAGREKPMEVEESCDEIFLSAGARCDGCTNYSCWF